MRMSGVEKFFVNSPWNAKRRIRNTQKLLGYATLEGWLDCLEVGCGNGAVSRDFAARYGARVIGIDVDPEQVELAQVGTNNIPDVKFLVADATHLPFEDNRFDVVMSFQVMHHISRWLDALAEVKRVLKPKGYFVYADIIYAGWLARLGRSFQHSYGITTIDDLDTFIQNNSLSTIHASRKNSLMWYSYEAVYQSN